MLERVNNIPDRESEYLVTESHFSLVQRWKGKVGIMIAYPFMSTRRKMVSVICFSLSFWLLCHSFHTSPSVWPRKVNSFKKQPDGVEGTVVRRDVIPNQKYQKCWECCTLLGQSQRNLQMQPRFPFLCFLQRFSISEAVFTSDQIRPYRVTPE